MTTPEAAPSGDEPGRSLTGRAVRGFLWSVGGLGAVYVSSYFTFEVASRILGAEKAGLVGAVLTVVLWIDVFLDTGLAASIVYEQESGQTHRVQVAFTLTTIMAIAGTAAVFFAAPLIASFYRASSQVGLFRLLAPLVFFKGMNQVPAAMLRRDMDFRRGTAVTLARAIVRFGVAYVLLKSGHGVAGTLLGVVAAEVVSTTLTWALVRFRPVIKFDRRVAREMFGYGVPVFLTTLLGLLWLNGDYLVIGRYYGAKSVEYGSYYTAFRLPELVLGGLYTQFSNIAFPMYAAARDVGPEKLKAAALRSLKLLCLFGFGAGVGMALISRDFILWRFKAEFAPAVPVMAVLCIAGGFVGVGYASGDLYNAMGRQKIGLAISLLGVPVLFTGFLIAVSHGIVAVAWVHVAVMVPIAIIRIHLSNRLIGTTWSESLAALWPAAVAVAGMCAAGLPVRFHLETGPLSLLAIMAAGGVGAVLALAIAARSTFNEFMDIARKGIGG